MKTPCGAGTAAVLAEPGSRTASVQDMVQPRSSSADIAVTTAASPGARMTCRSGTVARLLNVASRTAIGTARPPVALAVITGQPRSEHDTVPVLRSTMFHDCLSIPRCGSPGICSGTLTRSWAGPHAPGPPAPGRPAVRTAAPAGTVPAVSATAAHRQAAPVHIPAPILLIAAPLPFHPACPVGGAWRERRKALHLPDMTTPSGRKGLPRAQQRKGA